MIKIKYHDTKHFFSITKIQVAFSIDLPRSVQIKITCEIKKNKNTIVTVVYEKGWKWKEIRDVVTS